MGEESDTIVTIFYVWCTEDEIDATIKSSSIGISMGGGMGGTITYKTRSIGHFAGYDLSQPPINKGILRVSKF